MIEGEVTSRRALRDAYRDAVTDALEPVLEPVPGGEWDGAPAVLEPKLREAIASVFAGPPPGAPDGFAEVETPGTILVHAECPRCGIPAEITVYLGAVLTVDADGAEVSVKAKSKARGHTCGQLPLALGEKIEGEQTEIDFDGIVGPTTEATILEYLVGAPADFVVSDVEDYCAAEETIDPATVREDLPELRAAVEALGGSLVCARSIDHEGPHYAGGGASWYYETVPVPQGVEGNEDAPVGPAEEGASDGEEVD